MCDCDFPTKDLSTGRKVAVYGLIFVFATSLVSVVLIAAGIK